MSNTKEHLKDIDFRSREERSRHSVEDFKKWYTILTNYEREHGYDPLTHGQLTMLTAVLWYLLPEKEYEELRNIPKKTPTKIIEQADQEQLFELRTFFRE